MPGSHLSHTATVSAPSVVEYLPASQSVQAVAPVLVTYSPIAQLEQVVAPSVFVNVPS